MLPTPLQQAKQKKKEANSAQLEEERN